MALASKKTEQRPVVIGITLSLTVEEAKYLRKLLGDQEVTDENQPYNGAIYEALLDLHLGAA